MVASRTSAFAILILTAWSQSAKGATSGVDDYTRQFDLVVAQVRNEQPLDDSPLWKMPAERLLTNIEGMLNDRSLSVRFACVRWLKKLLAQTNEAAIRVATVKALLKVAKNDADGSLSRYALSSLLIAKVQDFDAESRKTIEQSVIGLPDPHADAILVAGIVGGKVIEDRVALLRSRAGEERPWYATTAWASHLAMARMGDAESMAYCVDRVRGEKDVVIRVNRLFNDIAYTRNPAGVALLKEALFSEERLPPVKDNVPGTLIAQRALDLLAQVIEGFPVKSGADSYSPEQLAAARQWMQSNSDLKIRK